MSCWNRSNICILLTATASDKRRRKWHQAEVDAVTLIFLCMFFSGAASSPKYAPPFVQKSRDTTTLFSAVTNRFWRIWCHVFMGYFMRWTQFVAKTHWPGNTSLYSISIFNILSRRFLVLDDSLYQIPLSAVSTNTFWLKSWTTGQ